jgi:macrolide-specific efflux system membrane fusion protein
MTANVTITLKKKTGVLAVPGTAVKRDGGRKFVSVLESGKPIRREVKTGWKDGTYLEITSGLKEGEVVVVSEGNGKK